MSAFVQGTGQQSSGSVASVAKAFTANVTAGNSIIAVCISSATAWPVSGGVTDNLGNTYVRDVVHTPGSGARGAIYRSHNVTGGACTVTADCGTDFMSLSIVEVSGLNNAAPTGSNNATGTSTAPNSGSTGAMASAGIAIGGVSHDGTTANTITPGGTYNQIFEAESVTNQPINAEYKIVAAGTYSADWTLSGSVQWHAMVAYYADAAGGGETITVDKWFARQDLPRPTRSVVPYF